MSLHLGLVAISGSHLHDADELLRVFEYKTVKTLDQPRDWDGVMKEVQENFNLKGMIESQGWTCILDRELVMPTDQEICQQISKMRHTQVMGALWEGISNTYLFSLFENGLKRRVFFSQAGHVLENVGDPFPIEASAGFDLSNSFLENEIEKWMRSLGFSLEHLMQEKNFILKQTQFSK